MPFEMNECKHMHDPIAPDGPVPKKRPWVPPQNAVQDVWSRFSVKVLSDVTAVLPVSEQPLPLEISQGQLVATEFEEKAQACRMKVAKIVEEHKALNQRYRDPHFDIDLDLKFRIGHCLGTLTSPVKFWLEKSSPENNNIIFRRPNPQLPQSVKRVRNIFKKPTFLPGKLSSANIKQGNLGNCWMLSALDALANMPELIERLCVAYDTDGEWISSIIDDNLYLASADWHMPSDEKEALSRVDRDDAERDHEEIHQTGSKALWFAQCRDQNETWLPLLEKAFAKAHGDFDSLEAGMAGEGIEDFTGGVNTLLLVADIWKEDDFWNDLKKVNDQFLFTCSTGNLDRGDEDTRSGIVEGHAYTIMEAKERKNAKGNDQRLLKLRDPWGSGRGDINGQWSGPWSDGSKEWTAKTLMELNNHQGMDSVFWIPYQDFLRKFRVVERTRLFSRPNSEMGWRLCSEWAKFDVPWNVALPREIFRFTLEKETPAVIVLSQLDYRYFSGLEGQYRFTLSFRLHTIDKMGADDYVARSQHTGLDNHARSIAIDLPSLSKGTYCVCVTVLADRYPFDSVEKVVENMCRAKVNNKKFSQVGMSYNMAHAKGAAHKEAQLKAKVAEDWKKLQARRKRAENRDHQRQMKAARWQSQLQSMFMPPFPVPDKTETAITKRDGPAVALPSDAPAPAKPYEKPALEVPNVGAKYDDIASEESKSKKPKIKSSLTIELLHPSNPQQHQKEEDGYESDSGSEYEREKLRTVSYAPTIIDGKPDVEDVDPWNAVCMLGLRVYSKDPDLRVEVVLPGQALQTGLDIDDKSASMASPVIERRPDVPESPVSGRRSERLRKKVKFSHEKEAT